MQIRTPSWTERTTRGWFILLALVSGCGGDDARPEPDSGSETSADASAPSEAGTSGGDATALGDSLVNDGHFGVESGPGLDGSLDVNAESGHGLDGSLDTNTSGATACSDNAAAYCAHLQTCSQTDLQILYGDMGTCTTQQKANCLAALAAPASGDNPSDIEHCAQAYAGWSCADFLDDVNVPAACRQARGSVETGDSCAFNSQCATGYCAISPGAACGTCGHALLPDDSCSGSLSSGQGLLCYGVISVPLGRSGAPCDDNHYPCGTGFSCVGGDAALGIGGKCQPAAEQAGATCDPTQFTAAGCDPHAGLTCNVMTMQCDPVAVAPGDRPCNAVGNEIAPCGAAGQCAPIGPGVVGLPAPHTGAGNIVPVTFFYGLCSPAAPVGGACDTGKGRPCIAGSRCIQTSYASTAGTCQVANAAACTPPVVPTGDGGAADAAGRHIEMRPITEFPALRPGRLALGADNNIWYATGDTSIGRISPAGVVTVFEIGYGMQISNVAAGIDGKIWWLNSKTAYEFVGRVALDGTGAEWQPLPMQYSGPVGITAGHGAMWFTQALSRQIGSVTSTWAFNEFSLDGQIPGDFDIVEGPDGNLWFSTYVGSICRVTPAGVPTCFPVLTPPDASPSGFTYGIAVGPDGNIWFTYGATIGRITPAGSVTLFPLPDASSTPTVITSGPDGNLWFTESADYVGRMTPTGDITEFPIPTAGAQMGSIVTGADGKLWFSEPGVDKIGTIAP